MPAPEHRLTDAIRDSFRDMIVGLACVTIILGLALLAAPFVVAFARWWFGLWSF